MPPSDQSPTQAPEPARTHLLSWVFLAVAFALLAWPAGAALDGGWDRSLRGHSGAIYTDAIVADHVRYGLGETKGVPTMVVEADGKLTKYVNYHHPPLYWVLFVPAVHLFADGNPDQDNAILRGVHMVLWLPGVLGLFWLLRQLTNRTIAGIACVLFASCPLTAYFGPMVLQDGAVLSFGLLTLASFQSHIDRPRRASWLRTAALFLITVTFDWTGYWYGLGMLGLALAHPQRWAAFRTVVTMFPVSLLGFAMVALHYGAAMDGPMAWLKAMGGVATTEKSGFADLGQEIRVAARHLFVNFQSWGLFSLALAAIPVGFFARRHAHVRRLLTTSLLLMLPGVVHYLVFLPHALKHVFWSLQCTFALAMLASIHVVVGWHLLRDRGVKGMRILGGALLTVSLGSAAFGVVWTDHLTKRHAPKSSEWPPAVVAANEHIQGCNHAATSAKIKAGRYGKTMVISSIRTVPQLEQLLALGRASNYPGEFAFILEGHLRDTPLGARLTELAEPIDAHPVLVYRFRP